MAELEYIPTEALDDPTAYKEVSFKDTHTLTHIHNIHTHAHTHTHTYTTRAHTLAHTHLHTHLYTHIHAHTFSK